MVCWQIFSGNNQQIIKVLRVTLNSYGSEYEMLIGHNELLGDDQEMVKALEKTAISDDQVEEIKHKLNDWIDDSEN